MHSNLSGTVTQSSIASTSWHLIQASNFKKWQCLLLREIEKEGCKLGMKTTMERNSEAL